MDKITLYIVVPCYNEEEVLPLTSKTLKEFVEKREELSSASRVVFVDDGSRDKTWETIQALCAADSLFAGLKLSRNRGHQNALWAGMDWAKDKCDCLVTIDADLQDDVNAMDGFLREFQAGADVVYGVRNKRDTDTAFKRLTAEGFYKLMERMGVSTVFNHADYRLLSKRAVEALMQYPEGNLFLRGMVPLVGLNTAKVYYDRGKRAAGESKYPLKKMLAFAWQGISSFSAKPISLVWKTGLAFVFIALVFGFIDLVSNAFNPGFTAFSVWFVGGMLLAGTGLVGEYVGKTYFEVKRRPRYLLQEIICSPDKGRESIKND
ncbi:MAG: glycosyltransferase family 2 protein [Clostridiales bacterium]|nr:glycosyltransferase family 2 protein [Clostridiales bacterium]